SGMALTTSAKRLSQSCEWSPVSTETKTVMPSPILSGSISATRRVMTPSASSFCSRFQHGVDDRPTRWPISATEREASCCTTARILRSMASILEFLGGREVFDYNDHTYRISLLCVWSSCHLYRKTF